MTGQNNSQPHFVGPVVADVVAGAGAAAVVAAADEIGSIAVIAVVAADVAAGGHPAEMPRAVYSEMQPTEQPPVP